MGTTGLLLLFETLMMTQLKRIVMPDQLWSGLTTAALSIKDRPEGSVKYATDDHNIKHKLAKNNFTTGTWNVKTMYCQGWLKELTYEMERYKWNVRASRNEMEKCWIAYNRRRSQKMVFRRGN